MYETKIGSTLDKNFKESYVMMSNYALTIDSNFIIGIMTPFWVCKKHQKWAKAIFTKRWAKVPIPIMRQQFTACLTWLQYGFLNHNSTTEMLSQSFWEDVGNPLLILSLLSQSLTYHLKNKHLHELRPQIRNFFCSTCDKLFNVPLEISFLTTHYCYIWWFLY
jgi:uncharacterized protein with PQ loop repeat